LLDVENLGLEPEFLLHLHSISDRPIQIRLAFGNWRRISAETEQFLLAEGFELVQTPQGANLADMKMTAVGAGLLLRWPTLGEVFVCSSDGDLDFLCTALVQQGLQVWRVRHHRDYLISDLVRQQHHVFVPQRTDAHTREAFPGPPPADGIPLKHPAHGFHTEEQLALYLRELIQEVQRTQPQSALHGISVNHLANLFSQRFAGPLNLLLKGVPSGTTLTAFLRKHRAFGFQLEQSQKNTCLVRL
jgi:hypothetical protein